MRLNSYLHPYLLKLMLIHQCLSFKFDPNYFGASFRPYVLKKHGGENYLSYNITNIETMLKVVSSKFSKILVQDSYAFQEIYQPGITYINGSYASLYCGEVAANMNKKNGHKVLTVLYEIGISLEDVDVEVPLVFEAAKIANQIFPGTVEAVIFGNTETLAHISQIRDYLETYKNASVELDIKLGAELINCFNELEEKNETITRAQKELVNNVEIVTCGTLQKKREYGPKGSFQVLGNDLLSFQKSFKHINPKVELIGHSHWSTYGSDKWETVENLKEYWESANAWASKNKVTVFLDEAFDNPYRKYFRAHNGWWKLKHFSLINSVEGYEEKVQAQENKDDKAPTTWSGTTVGLFLFGGLALIAISFSLSTFLFFRWKKQPKVLSSNEIRLFISGSVKSDRPSKGTALENALNGPYDQSLEIPKDKLKFDDDDVLGEGQFGSVYKVTIEVDEDVKNEVAIKVAKQSCASTLRGLLSEIKIMSYLGKHPNIVSLEGAYTAELARGVVYVATELCTLGSVESYLRKSPSARNGNEISKCNSQKPDKIDGMERDIEMSSSFNVSFYEMIQWSYQIACGMEYLESKHVVHADLATRNVLLTSLKIAKITDFGLSRRMYNYMNYVKSHQEPLPWRWMAIESLQKLEFSSKSDVWSYGVTLWEIFSKGNIPYQGLSWTQGFSKDLVDGLRPECPSFASPDIYKMMQDCWNCEPAHRPSFSQLVSCTETMVQNCARKNDETYLILEKEVGRS